MPCQSRFVGFLIMPLQSARGHDNILTDVLAVHCMQQMQWKDRLALRDSCRTMDWPNYFPIDFLVSWVAQDPHKQCRMSGLEPYASDSRGRFSVLKSHVISAHYTGIETESLLCVFVCQFLSSLVHKNSAKWVWLCYFLRKFFNFMVYSWIQALHQPCKYNSSTNLAASLSCSSRSPGTCCRGIIS